MSTPENMSQNSANDNFNSDNLGDSKVSPHPSGVDDNRNSGKSLIFVSHSNDDYSRRE